ncbi:AMP-binding protein [Vibrio salilacus]|uniref:AMP-binding protein n=1 Tax=Vibrio salilacus TaxID=1323749 RepID=UPI0012FDB128|nr:AMP-binding protein [Vibrio salilacus]
MNKLRILEDYDSNKVKLVQFEMLTNVLKYSYTNTDYYNKLFDDNGFDWVNIESSFKELPILTKDTITSNSESLISKKIPRSQLVKRNTGGSTGEPLEFYSDKPAGLVDNAHHWYLYSLMGFEDGDVIVGSGGNDIKKELRENNIYWTKKDPNCVWGEYSFSVLYITDDNIHYYVNKLIEIRPAILRGYPSFFDKLASYILKNKISLPFHVKGVNLTAEMCSPAQRDNIEKAFSTLVYFEYGHTELALYCYTQDKSYVYKSSPIYGYIEVLDDKGRDVGIGEVGNIVVTGFNNLGMPFIRYDTGDMGELAYRNGGTVHFNKIQGRNQDYIISKDNQKIFLTALIFGQHMTAFKNIKQWQLAQNEKGKVIINIVRGDGFTIEDELNILVNFNNVADIELSFNYVDHIKMTNRGKHLFLVQNIKET